MVKLTSLILSLFFITSAAYAGRIRLRKVKDAPKVCSVMDEDKHLSRTNRRILGTLKTSVIFEDNITVVNDLGKKVCLWSYDKWLPLGDVAKYTYYIDEQKNVLYPYIKTNNQYQYLKISLDNCEMGELQTTDKLTLPKCEKPSRKKSRSKSKRKIAKK